MCLDEGGSHLEAQNVFAGESHWRYVEGRDVHPFLREKNLLRL